VAVAEHGLAARHLPRLVTTIAVLSVAGAVPAVVGAVVFWAFAGGSITHAIASGFWFAAAILFLGMFVATSKSLWRRTTIAVPEGWMFLSAAVVLTAVGVAVDVA
jgi:hypothetical protein